MKWWDTQPEAWAKARENLRDPKSAMPDYVAWLKGLTGKPVFVAYPVAFDFSFMHWYLQNFATENPFGYSALDIKTYRDGVRGYSLMSSVAASQGSANSGGSSPVSRTIAKFFLVQNARVRRTGGRQYSGGKSVNRWWQLAEYRASIDRGCFLPVETHEINLRMLGKKTREVIRCVMLDGGIQTSDSMR